MAAEEHAHDPGDYIIHHLTHFGTGKPKGLVDFSVINFDSVFFSVALGVLGCFLMLAGRARKVTSGRSGALPGRRRVVAGADRQRGQGHRPQRHQPQVRRAAGPDGVRLGAAAQHDGPAAGRSPAAPVEAGCTARPVTTPSTPTYASVPTADLSITMAMSVGVLLLCLYLQHQDQGPRRLAARGSTWRRSAPSRSPPIRSPGSAFFSCRWPTSAMQLVEYVSRPSRTACGCSATCTRAS